MTERRTASQPGALMKEILSLLENAPAEGPDAAALEAKLMELEELAPTGLVPDQTAAWEALLRRCPALAQVPPLSRASGPRRRWRAPGGVSLAAAAALALLIGVNAAGYNPVRSLVEALSGAGRLTVSMTEAGDLSEYRRYEYASLRAALEASGAAGARVPGWLPEDFAPDTALALKNGEDGAVTAVTAVYVAPRGELYFTVVPAPGSADAATLMATEPDYEHESVLVGGERFVLARKGGVTRAYGLRDGFGYAIFGDVSRDELVRLLEATFG